MLFQAWFQEDKGFYDFSHYKPNIERVEGGVSIFSPAKLNLYLKVGKKLKNGYHNIETIYAGISLADVIFVSKMKKRRIELYSNVQQILNKENTIVKVIQFLIKKYEVKSFGFKVILQKNIPVGGGLGGENSNAVFTYFAINKLLSKTVGVREAENDLRQFGADNLFFLYGGICYGEGLPDKISDYKLHIPDCEIEKCYILLIYPFLKTDTQKMYGLLDKYKKQIPDSQDSNSFIYNDFKDMLCKKYKKIKIIFDKIEDMGLKDMSGISGSGSTIFIILKSNEEVMNIWRKLSSAIENISGACARFVENWRNILFN